MQGTYYGGDSTGQFNHLPFSGTGFLASLEEGIPFSLPLGPNFILEPQGQLIVHQVGLDKVDDEDGSVDLGSTLGVTGRLGLRGQWTIEDNGQVWQPYVRTNLWRDSGAQATTTFDGVACMPLAQEATRLEVGAGITAKFDNSMSLYGQFGYQQSLNDSTEIKREGVGGNLGMRYVW